MKPVLTILLLSLACSARAHCPVADFDAAAPLASASVPVESTPAVFAVPPDPSAESLREEVAALERETSAWEKVLARLPRISGYVQAGYEGSEHVSTFFLKRVRLNLAGDIAPKLDYRVQIEFCSPKIVDAYLRYRPFGELGIQLGEYKLPFSIENTEYVPLKYELIEYPLSLRKLMGFNDLCGLSATGRDLGAMLFGGFFRREGYDILSYHIGVFNGEGLNTKDRNRSKDLCARLTLRPVAGLQIAGSCYRGEYGPDYRKRIRYGAGACYDRGPLVLRGEYICGTTGMPAGDAGPAFELDSEGWYAVAGWRATRTLLPVVRYDTFRESASSESRQTNYTAGVVWQPVKYLRCQLNYTYEDHAARAVANRNVVAVMLSGIF